jgi:hypothetical protein
VISLIAAALLCLVFARGALHKATGFAEFRAAVFDYRVVPERLVGAVSVGILAAEVVAICAIAIPALRPIGASIAAALLGIYAIAIAFNMLRGRSRIDCGCGGAGQALSWWLVVRNALLIGACLLVASPVELRTLTFLEIIAAAGCAIVLWLLLVLLDQMLANRSHALATSTLHSN